MMELIERYIYAVQRALPQSQREEIAKELRSDIQDMMEHEKGDETTRAKVILARLGRPEDLALQYTGSVNYLIGPKWYGSYLSVLKKVLLFALPVIFLIQFADVVFNGSQPTVIEIIIEAIIGVFTTATIVLFWITATFVILERSEPHLKASDKKMFQWSVDDLPELPAHRGEVKVSDTIANIVFYAAMIVLLLLTATVLGVKDGAGQHLSFFNPTLWSFWLPIVVVLLGGLIANEVVSLRRGKKVGVIITGMLLNTVLVAIIAWLYFTGALVNPLFADRAQDALGDFSFEWAVLVTIVIYITGYVWDMITSVWRLLKRD